MPRLMILACTVILLTACNSENSQQATAGEGSSNTQPVITEGWSSLFDAQSTAGWHKYGGGAAGRAWKVADGVLYLDTTGKAKGGFSGGDLVSDEEFENFHLKLEWKISPGGNSGIIFYTQEDTSQYKQTWHTGPEVQIADAAHPDAKIIKHKAGDLYDLVASTKEMAKPTGEWNQAEIKAINGKLDLFLNGENVVSTMMWDENWDKLVAGSKFKDMPGFGKYKKGHIVLQDHGDGVYFRNIVVKRL